MDIQRFNIPFILLILLVLIGCNENTKPIENPLSSCDFEDEIASTEENTTPNLIDTISLVNANKSISFENKSYSFQLPPAYTLFNQSHNYFVFSTPEEYGPNFSVNANIEDQDDSPKTNSEALKVYSELFKGWIIDRKEIAIIDGIEFSLIMAADTSTTNQINYEFVLHQVGDIGSVEFRFTDGSLRYNYSPEEALVQMKAAANKLLKSIRVKAI